MYELQTSVTFNSVEYQIRERGDFRMVLDCFEVLEDIELTEPEQISACLLIFFEDFNTFEDLLNLDSDVFQNLVTEMFNFFNCGESKSPAAETNFKSIDWKEDSQLICSAINKVAGQEVRSLPYLHWWTFMGYFCEVGESPLSTVVGIRSKIAKGKKLEKYEIEFKNNNPKYFMWDKRTAEQKAEEELIKELWNKG